MRLTRKGILGIAIAATLVMAAAAIPVLGQGWGYGHHRDEHHGRMMDRLDLTEDQRAEVEAVMAERHDAMDANIDRLRTARETLFDAIHAPEFDETAIRDAAAAVGAIEADLAVERGLGFQEFRKILTPEQQAEFEEMKKTLRAYHDEFGGRGGYGPGRHGRNHR